MIYSDDHIINKDMSSQEWREFQYSVLFKAVHRLWAKGKDIVYIHDLEDSLSPGKGMEIFYKAFPPYYEIEGDNFIEDEIALLINNISPYEKLRLGFIGEIRPFSESNLYWDEDGKNEMTKEEKEGIGQNYSINGHFKRLNHEALDNLCEMDLKKLGWWNFVKEKNKLKADILVMENSNDFAFSVEVTSPLTVRNLRKKLKSNRLCKSQGKYYVFNGGIWYEVDNYIDKKNILKLKISEIARPIGIEEDIKKDTFINPLSSILDDSIIETGNSRQEVPKIKYYDFVDTGYEKSENSSENFTMAEYLFKNIQRIRYEYGKWNKKNISTLEKDNPNLHKDLAIKIFNPFIGNNTNNTFEINPFPKNLSKPAESIFCIDGVNNNCLNLEREKILFSKQYYIHSMADQFRHGNLKDFEIDDKVFTWPNTLSKISDILPIFDRKDNKPLPVVWKEEYTQTSNLKVDTFIHFDPNYYKMHSKELLNDLSSGLSQVWSFIADPEEWPTLDEHIIKRDINISKCLTDIIRKIDFSNYNSTNMDYLSFRILWSLMHVKENGFLWILLPNKVLSKMNHHKNMKNILRKFNVPFVLNVGKAFKQSETEYSILCIQNRPQNRKSCTVFYDTTDQSSHLNSSLDLVGILSRIYFETNDYTNKISIDYCFSIHTYKIKYNWTFQFNSPRRKILDLDKQGHGLIDEPKYSEKSSKEVKNEKQINDEELASKVSHWVKNVLPNAYGRMERACKDLKQIVLKDQLTIKDKSDLSKHIERLSQSRHRLINLESTLKSFNEHVRIPEPDLKLININTLVEYSVKSYQGAYRDIIEEKGISVFINTIDKNLSLKLDEGQIEGQVLMNLLRNSMQHAFELKKKNKEDANNINIWIGCGVPVKPYRDSSEDLSFLNGAFGTTYHHQFDVCAQGYEGPPNYDVEEMDKIEKIIIIDYQDNGKGIENVSDEIFVPFSKDGGKGGIGMADVKKVVENHKGKVQLHKPAIGFHITISFPVYKDSKK